MLQLYLIQGAANGCLCRYHLSSRIYMYAVQCFQIPRLAGLIIQRLVLRL